MTDSAKFRHQAIVEGPFDGIDNSMLVEQENARLREALRKIARRWPCQDVEHMSRVAKEALGEEIEPVEVPF